MQTLVRYKRNPQKLAAWLTRGRAAFLFLLVISSSLVNTSLLAQEQSSAQQSQPVDVRVLIDISGSMKQNDPQNLRQPALELLVKLLPEGSKAGVWTFGRYINMLVPHRVVNDEWRRLANSKTQEINSTGLYTNIGEALEKSAYDLASSNQGYRTSLILLTDGVVDISRDPDDNQKEWRRIVDEILPGFKKSDFVIHTVSLSKNADSELMNKLSLSTDGVSSVAESADELMKVFLAAFDSAVPAEQVPLEDNRFVVDSSVEEFTALIFRKPSSPAAQLVSPDQEAYRFDEVSPYVKWHRSEKYDLITVTRPLEGEWKIIADIEPDSRVTIVSNLNLLVKPIQNNFAVNQAGSLSLLLQEDGVTITREEFLKILDIGYRIERREDSKVWEGVLAGSSGSPNTSASNLNSIPRNGIFEASLDMFDAEGSYDIKVAVDGKSFQREFSHTVSVREPFGITVTKDSDGVHLVTVSSHGNIDLQKTRVTARVESPSGRNTIRPMSLTAVDNWQLHLETTIEGIYNVALNIDAVDSTAGEFKFTPPPVHIQYPDQNDPFLDASKRNTADEINEANTQLTETPQIAVLVPEIDVSESLPESQLVVPDIAEPEIVEPQLAVPEIVETEMPELEVGDLSVADSLEDSASDKEEPKPQEELDTSEPVENVESDLDPAEEDSMLWLYIGLGVGNVVILVLAFVAYRLIMGKKEEPDADEPEQAGEEAKPDSEASEESTSAEPPSMAAIESTEQTEDSDKPGDSQAPESLEAGALDGDDESEDELREELEGEQGEEEETSDTTVESENDNDEKSDDEEISAGESGDNDEDENDTDNDEPSEAAGDEFSLDNFEADDPPK